MNNILVAGLALASIFSWLLPQSDFETMRTRGLIARVSVVVVDYDGNPIENASVRFSFETGKGTTTSIQHTDSQGHAVSEGRVNIFVRINVAKDGYYTNGAKIDRFVATKDTSKMKGGRWVCDDSDIVIPMKKILVPRKEIFMRSPMRKYRGSVPPVGTNEFFRQRISLDIPATNIIIGIDLQRGDWTEPFGFGSTNDLFLVFNQTISRIGKRRNLDIDMHRELTMSTAKAEGAGFIRFPKDTRCPAMPYPYRYPHDGYGCQMVLRHDLSRSETEIFRRSNDFDLATSAEFIMLRTLSRGDAFNYGLIQEINFGFNPATGKGTFNMEYFFNRICGDDWCEYQ